MDFKQSIGKPRFKTYDMVISRGTKFIYKILEASKEFYTAFAIAEMKGVGKRTSFGKGEFLIM